MVERGELRPPQNNFVQDGGEGAELLMFGQVTPCSNHWGAEMDGTQGRVALKRYNDGSEITSSPVLCFGAFCALLHSENVLVYILHFSAFSAALFIYQNVLVRVECFQH